MSLEFVTTPFSYEEEEEEEEECDRGRDTSSLLFFSLFQPKSLFIVLTTKFFQYIFIFLYILKIQCL
jgi:hypothetical protein